MRTQQTSPQPSLTVLNEQTHDIGTLPIQNIRFAMTISIWCRLIQQTSTSRMLFSFISPLNGLVTYLLIHPYDMNTQSYD
jgi:hypothetical protein